ncbi:MAG TPA: zinc ribbon domain-containing protein [Pirellulales bacterium]|nr:zinc ribbon domain-containing protein [Pirellulales bacterium]
MDEAPIARTCPQCGQPLPPGAESCANCGRDEANPFTSPASPLDEPKSRNSSPQLLFELVTVICVSLGIGFLWPGLGVFFAIVFVPAVIRAAAVIKRRQETGPLKDPTGQMVTALFASAGVTIAVWMASAVAFAAVCTPVGLVAISIDSGSAVAEILAFGLGGLAGLAVFYWFMRKLWPRSAKDEDATA